MLLKPEEVTFVDLINILFSTDIEKTKFVDSPEAKEESFERRWLIFISVVAQKSLQFFSKPMAFVGSRIEIWLNLLSSNRGFGRLLLNVLRGCCLLLHSHSRMQKRDISNFLIFFVVLLSLCFASIKFANHE